MNKLFDIEQEDISLLVRQTILIGESGVLDALSVAINNVPSISKNVCMYIDQICVHQPAFKEPILEILLNKAGNHTEVMCRRIYGELLGIRGEPQLVECLFQTFSEESLKHAKAEKNNNPIKIELMEIPEIFKPLFENKNFFEVFCCYATIQKFNFNKNECRYRLSAYDEEHIVEAMLIEENTCDIAMVIELCKFKGFFTVLCNKIALFRRRLEILALIFTVYYYDQYILGTIYSSDSFNIFRDCREIIVELLGKSDLVDYIYYFGSPTDLGNFIGRDLPEENLPKITFKDFQSMDTTNLTDFFKAFLLLTSISPTHFFSYLEFYKDRFINLTEESQREFCQMFEEFYRNHKAISGILKEKLIKFGIIKVQW